MDELCIFVDEEERTKSFVIPNLFRNLNDGGSTLVCVGQ